jgi:membrane protease YdiL (CAAX protease family)
LKIDKGPKLVFIGISFALLLWYFVFLSNFLGSFWIRVTLASIILSIYAALFNRDYHLGDQEVKLQSLWNGVLSGFLLYILFHIGYNILESYLQQGASRVYLLAENSSLYVAVVALIITSFCEEFFWRRFIQRTLISRYGITIGLTLSTAVYGLIHLSTFNLPLILAALISGFYWGVLYEYTRSFWLIAISHIIWTELIFIILPLV